MGNAEETTTRTAGKAGWHASRYNLFAPVPGTKMTAIANLYKGNCAEYTPIEMHLNTAYPMPDAECHECVWLPMCVGGCPHVRLLEHRRCIAFKDDPEAYVLALHARIGKEESA